MAMATTQAGDAEAASGEEGLEGKAKETLNTVKAAAVGMTRSSVKKVIAASMVGTAIEFYDFYAYGTAAANYFPKLFFPETDPTVAVLASLLTFAVAFLARPLGSLIFGHFGDRMGRKTTLVVSLLFMGLSTVVIGLLPGYSTLGVWAVALLCLCRFFQGIGLGGEWSGAALVATENAPADKRALYGAFPELGAPIGFFLSNGTFFVLEAFCTPEQMLSWGWRVPFLLSALLVIVGLAVRVTMEETPVFKLAVSQNRVVKAPLKEVFKNNWRQVLQATFLVAVTYTLFYTLATWSLSYGTQHLGFTSQEYLAMLMLSIVVFAVFIVLSCLYADKVGRRKVIIFSSLALVVFSALFPLLLETPRSFGLVLTFLCVGFVLMGVAFGPIGAFLPELFPANVRYSGAGIGYNLAAIVGAAFAPSIATCLAENGGVRYVGVYLGVMAVCCLVAVLSAKETKNTDFSK